MKFLPTLTRYGGGLYENMSRAVPGDGKKGRIEDQQTVFHMDALSVNKSYFSVHSIQGFRQRRIMKDVFCIYMSLPVGGEKKPLLWGVFDKKKRQEGTST